MKRKEAFAQLFSGIERDLGRYRQLHGLLNQQFAAALRRDSSALAATGHAIVALADALIDNHRARGRCARALTEPAEPKSMADVCAVLPAAPCDALAREWTKLETLVTECKRLNQRNASLLMSQFEIVQRVLYGEVDTYVQT
ncbi:flagellar protein FlgN [Burkholderia oklahomensis]|uniref:FlgN family protein n=1 Tax=Burkholderia oklahomensis TaxID=342113 RepID=A0AAI8BDI6_9BURK|nr:flagellar protein FlgN [Burkholderia oklahomensis]AIO70135.1 flgN family protein [Burkholderia oklahomensis]AJX33789.1 flgN family protein [Burkholderia oklahomensis C6786]AOI38245.1 flagellar biosynthesis protein FliR [Burkholderia oklahomensis EO147]AOI47968.1 flagellar biosynthesis protein FliR [Burkholderia oklahomensis C6786]KUY48629.1 flagellar biosynthesis protein FliR [Burkholderia oklahomensis EO147]